MTHPDAVRDAVSLIDGVERAPGPHGQAAHRVVNPFTEQAVATTSEAGPDLVDAAVGSSQAAFRVWSRTPLAERCDFLERLAALVERDAEHLAGLVSMQMGMPIVLARVTQGQLPAAVLRGTVQVARSLAWEEAIDGATLLRRPAGVIGAVTPWNMPVHQIVAKVSAAFAAGCSVVLKPSEQTPLDALHLASLVLEAGGPAGLLNVVTGTGPVTGSALAGHPGLRRFSLTGSVRAGREVARLAAANLVPCALELGGKSAAIVLPDADLQRAIPAVVGSGLVNSGQACNATTRLLVPSDRLDECLQLMVQTVEGMRLGDPSDPQTQQGPLVTSSHRDTVMRHVQRAVDEGATLVTGSGRPSEQHEHGYFLDPVILTGLDQQAAAVREEIFGPVLVVQPYTDPTSAVEMANDSQYGLSAEVWGRDQQGVEHVAQRLEVGQVKVNGVRTRNRPMVPFGGVRNSGYGRELGTLGLEEFLDVTAVMA